MGLEEQKLLNKFLFKNWSRSGLDSLLRQIDATRSAESLTEKLAAKTLVKITKVVEELTYDVV